jgi:hypothetical protein
MFWKLLCNLGALGAFYSPSLLAGDCTQPPSANNLTFFRELHLAGQESPHGGYLHSTPSQGKVHRRRRYDDSDTKSHSLYFTMKPTLWSNFFKSPMRKIPQFP